MVGIRHENHPISPCSGLGCRQDGHRLTFAQLSHAKRSLREVAQRGVLKESHGCTMAEDIDPLGLGSLWKFMVV